MRKLLWVTASAFVLAVVSIILFAAYIHRYMHKPIDLNEAAYFVIEPGVGLRQVSDRLHTLGIISEPEFFHWYSRLRGKATAIRAGEYEVSVGSTPAELLERLVAGDVVLHSLTVVEGWTFRQMQQQVASHPAITSTDKGASTGAIMEALGAENVHPEGQFFPDTYRFTRGTTDVDIYRQAYRLMQTKLAEAWAQRDEGLSLSGPYQALILASIIEKESALGSERKIISGVFSRRLRRGMRLQTDPTVIYGLGPDFNGNITRRDLTTDTPYNTYTRSGLPPTPIALPGMGSLEAAVQPEAGEALYFVATGLDDGSHYFSATLEEHNRAVQRYLETLRKRRQNNEG
ncbi:MAG: endolytic transglycosylase MltG [Gammaproteobacteria bacterium]|nr:endolytic transglycosylase MltG [Gammaproteobacteria bacterium]